ncbi:uncharacterized protein LOC129005569 [Macrosteles quadrilineatus]|uniref:uncharacterized protein LOC129005569 n=1 Tax=Macrosteles quadrilineatus TaxID=74068 RepID=UPI0023E1BDD7|nr:uncharacterized protein LOC129005569 [Macrosteles quadrilineatus]
MDVYLVDHFYRSNNICCELVWKTKQYINILQYESHRLFSLQIECNQLLDIFYGLKEEFGFFLKEGVHIKYLGLEDVLEKEYTKEFTLFLMNVWQIGKHKFSEKGKKVQYLCYVGKLLSEVILLITSFVNEVMHRLNYMPFHSECTATIHTICNEIYAVLQSDCLKSADECLRQYVYLQDAIPFLRELNGLINKYLLLPKVHTPKQFLDRIILKIPPIEDILATEDTEDTEPFRFVVNLLNGKLLGDEVLDQNTDIRPIVEDDINFKKSMTIVKTVDWILQQYNIQDIPMVAKHSESINRYNTNLYRNHKPLGYNTSDLFEPFDFGKLDWMGLYSSQLLSQRKYSRRGKRSGPNNTGSRSSDDLQPIKLEKLQTPLLLPLL